MTKNTNIKIYNGNTKKGKPFEALQVVVGEYSTLIFPTKIEMLYIKNVLEEDAHKDFKKDLEDDLNGYRDTD